MTFLSRYRILLLVLGGLVALYALSGFVGVPYAVKTYGIPALSDRLGHPVLLEEIRVNPFTFSVELTRFEIQELDHTPMLGFQELFLDFDATSLVRSAYLFEEIRLTLPFGVVHLQADGTLNLLGLMPRAPDEADRPAPPPEEKTDKGSMPAVDIRLLSIQRGVLEYRDDTKHKPVTIDVVPIEISVRNFSSRGGGESAYAFTAEFGEKEVLSWKGTFDLDPLESDGHVSLSHVGLNTFWPSVRDQFRFDILSGRVSAEAHYHFDTHRAPLNLRVTEGKVQLADFRLSEAGSRDPVLTVPSLGLDGISMHLSKRELGIGTVSLTDAKIRAWLGQDGVLNFTPLFAPVAATPETATRPKPSDSEPEEPWKVDVQAIEVAKTQVEFEDRRLGSPVELAFDDLHMTLNDVNVPFKGPVPVTASFQLNQQGTLETKGTLRLDPLQTELALKLNHIGLRPFQPYLDHMVQLTIKDGELALDGEVTYRSRPESEPMLQYRGQAGLNNLHLAERGSNKEFLGWTALSLNTMALDVTPTTVKIGEIALRDPVVHLVTGKDGITNLSRVLHPPDTAPAPASKRVEQDASRKATTPTPVEVAVVQLTNLSATFVDESIVPSVSTGITNLTGTIKGLSSRQVAKADVALTGKVDEVAPLKIQGQINPLSEEAFTHLTFLFQGVDLTSVSPYAGKFVGYPITKGKLSLDLTYQLSKNRLVGENKVLVDQLMFGEKTDSPDATTLPVRLAVGLLKDRRGRIDIDMPVRGDLADPDFRYGRVVLNALVNLLTKVATSPFSALGGLVGGGGEELQFVEFQAGSEVLEPAEQHKLESIAKALQERPALRVEVAGIADPARDRQALALRKIAAEVQRRFTQGGTKNLEAAPSPSREFELLSDLYAEKLGKQPMKREDLPGGKSVERVLTAEELRQQLFPAMTVEDSELRSLAQERAKTIREHLIEQGHLSDERVFLVEAELAASDKPQIRVRLNLTGS